jgi:histidinol-phosphate aminotransferase
MSKSLIDVSFIDLATPGVQQLTPYPPGKPVEELERELGISNSIKLASNENPLGPSPMAL